MSIQIINGALRNSSSATGEANRAVERRRDEVIISVRNVGKMYRLSTRPQDRSKHSFLARFGRGCWREFWARRDVKEPMPAVFHVTHWKAGSQWIYKILRECVPAHIIVPEVSEVQFLNRPLHAGKVYPTVYVTKAQFDSVRLPGNWRRFTMIRDLRDTLISAYFSFKVSHPVIDPTLEQWRSVLRACSLEQGLIYLMDEWLPNCARIQTSWLDANERLIRYEDLLEHDLEILEPVLLDECRLPVTRERFREVVRNNRFAWLTNGRERGQEDITAHERKGIVGDWRNYFNEQVTRAFKTRYGDLLIATGYESDSRW